MLEEARCLRLENVSGQTECEKSTSVCVCECVDVHARVSVCVCVEPKKKGPLTVH